MSQQRKSHMSMMAIDLCHLLSGVCINRKNLHTAFGTNTNQFYGYETETVLMRILRIYTIRGRGNNSQPIIKARPFGCPFFSAVIATVSLSHRA